MSRQTRRLFDLEIDEVSAVDRPANQHGLISFAKALGEDDTPLEGGMGTIYAESGAEVAVEDLNFGDVVRDEDGNESVYWPVDEAGEPLSQEDAQALVDELAEAEEPAPVGKATGFRALKPFAATVGRQAAETVKKNPGKTAAAAAGAAGVAGGGAYMEAKKSLSGTAVLELLSKAVTDADRDEIISKMAETTQDALDRAEAVEKALEEERDIRLTDAFISKAAEYKLPVDAAVFGPILKAIAEVLDDEQLDVLDRVLTESGNALYEELGYAGGASNSGVLDEISGMAAELVGKAAGNVTLEQATVAMLGANPAAYDSYLAEQNGR